MIQSTWKYLSIGLAAVLAVGLLIPQASAHITSNTQHMLQHIYNFVDGIEAKTNNLPEDPADQSLLDEQLDDIQLSIGSISAGGAVQKSVQVAMVVNPAGPDIFEIISLFPLETGTTYSGRIAGTYEVSPDNRLQLQCLVGHATESLILMEVDNLGAETVHGEFNEEFVCDSLRFHVFDYLNGAADQLIIKATGQAFESSDATQIPN